jgi:hypothetical protein
MSIFLVATLLIFSFFYFNSFKYITLEKAYLVSLKPVQHYDPKVKLVSITSSDKENIIDLKDGSNSNRRFWNLEYAVPNTSVHYIVEIADRHVSQVTEVKGAKLDESKFIKFDSIALDTTKALSRAIKEFQLSKGEDWAFGYHFTLDNIDGVITLSIIGLDKDNRFTKIKFDGSNGDIVSTTHKLFS